MTLPLQLAAYLFCVCSTGFFAGIETGVISMNRLRLLHRARQGSKNAQLLSGYLRQPDRLLGTTLVGCNLMSVILSTLASDMGAPFGSAGISAAAALTTLVLLLFGEFLPKSWFASRPLRRCVPAAPLLRFCELVFLPVSKLLMLATCWIKGDTWKGRRQLFFVTRENLRWLAKDSEAGGQISPLENLMIGRVLSLQLKTAADVMTPLAEVRTLRADARLADAADLARASHHMKFPVMDESRSRCIGVLNVRDVLSRIMDSPDARVKPYVRQPLYVKPDVRADDVLPILRRSRHKVALVRDRSGRLLGIITVAGLLRLIVGKLPDQ
ncbi:MAG: DUF21 domain-containing protein [Kiritimatiellae bacterium]|nr:DUF21 domain-containing protein [Kiritimatiellia bacterium]